MVVALRDESQLDLFPSEYWGIKRVYGQNNTVHAVILDYLMNIVSYIGVVLLINDLYNSLALSGLIIDTRKCSSCCARWPENYSLKDTELSFVGSRIQGKEGNERYKILSY
jgi:hypothetical protein